MLINTCERAASVRIVQVVLFLTFILMLSATAALCETESVNVDGIATLQQNAAIARDNAINDALRKAVEQVMGTMVSSETIVENSQLVGDNITSKAQGYVKKYKVTKETSANSLYVVTIFAEVGLSELRSDLDALGLLQARAGKPRTLFLIFEQHGSQPPVAWWGGAGTEAASEAALRGEFLAKQFNVIDSSLAIPKLAGVASRDQYPSDGAAREMGRIVGAEVIVKGKASSREGIRNPGSPVGSWLAEVSASAIRVDTGEVLASGRGQGVARHITPEIGENNALEAAGRDLSRKLIDQIVAKWTAETSGAALTRITIRGLKSMQELVRVKDYLLGKVRGVQQVNQRSFEEGVAVLDVSARGNAQQLGDELARKAAAEFSFDVTKATANTLELTAVSR
jgi:hypothetical protein